LVLGSGIFNASESFWVRAETFNSLGFTVGKEVAADEGEVGEELADLGVGEDKGKDSA